MGKEDKAKDGVDPDEVDLIDVCRISTIVTVTGIVKLLIHGQNQSLLKFLGQNPK